MQGIQPQHLTDKELAHYADFFGAANLNKEWTAELIKRLQAHVDAQEERERYADDLK